MIITRDTAEGYWRILFAEKDVVRVEVEPDDLTVWVEWSDQPWTIREFKEDSSMRRWLQAAWDTMPVVCVRHQRWGPCLRSDDCEPSLEYEDIEMVRTHYGERRS